LKNDTITVYENEAVPIGCEEIENKTKDCRPFWEMIHENEETETFIKENKGGKYFGLERDPPCLTILNAAMSDSGYYCCCIEYSTSNGRKIARSEKAHLIIEKSMHIL
jgi:hypothetical protein